MIESGRGNPTRRSRLIVLAGPTAVGKGTVAADVRRRHPEVWISVSATTRPPRPGEENGVHYWFVSDEEFDAMIEKGDLLEWAVVHKAARYGTPRAPGGQTASRARNAGRNAGQTMGRRRPGRRRRTPARTPPPHPDLGPCQGR